MAGGSFTRSENETCVRTRKKREGKKKINTEIVSTYRNCKEATCEPQVQIRGSIVVSISACHAEDPGSIPGRGIKITLTCGPAAAPADHQH